MAAAISEDIYFLWIEGAKQYKNMVDAKRSNLRKRCKRATLEGECSKVSILEATIRPSSFGWAQLHGNSCKHRVSVGQNGKAMQKVLKSQVLKMKPEISQRHVSSSKKLLPVWKANQQNSCACKTQDSRSLNTCTHSFLGRRIMLCSIFYFPVCHVRTSNVWCNTDTESKCLIYHVKSQVSKISHTCVESQTSASVFRSWKKLQNWHLSAGVPKTHSNFLIA